VQKSETRGPALQRVVLQRIREDSCSGSLCIWIRLHALRYEHGLRLRRFDGPVCLPAGDRRGFVAKSGGTSFQSHAIGYRCQTVADELTVQAMQEIVTHFRRGSGLVTSNEQSSRSDHHMLECMNVMTEMGVPPNERTIMWHYEVDRRSIIDSVIKSQQPPAI